MARSPLQWYIGHMRTDLFDSPMAPDAAYRERGWSCVRLGSVGIELFPIGFGAMRLSTPGRPQLYFAQPVIREALDAGVNFIDTANAYCLDETEEGHNEQLIGGVLRNHAGGRQIIVASKAGILREEGGWQCAASPWDLRRACEKSLRDLEVDRIDLYQLHAPDPKVPFSESVGALAVLREEEKVRHIGICNVTREQVEMAIDIAPVQSVQNTCHPLRKVDLANGLIDLCRERGLTYIACAPLGGSAHSAHSPWKQHPEAYEAVEAIARTHGVSPQAVMLAWLRSKGDHILPIPGTRTPGHISDCCSAAYLRLDQEQIETIDRFPDVEY